MLTICKNETNIKSNLHCNWPYSSKGEFWLDRKALTRLSGTPGENRERNSVAADFRHSPTHPFNSDGNFSLHAIDFQFFRRIFLPPEQISQSSQQSLRMRMRQLATAHGIFGVNTSFGFERLNWLPRGHKLVATHSWLGAGSQPLTRSNK